MWRPWVQFWKIYWNKSITLLTLREKVAMKEMNKPLFIIHPQKCEWTANIIMYDCVWTLKYPSSLLQTWLNSSVVYGAVSFARTEFWLELWNCLCCPAKWVGITLVKSLYNSFYSFCFTWATPTLRVSRVKWLLTTTTSQSQKCSRVYPHA